MMKYVLMFVDTEQLAADLLALIRLHRARAAASLDQNSEIIQLQHQDRSLWNQKPLLTT